MGCNRLMRLAYANSQNDSFKKLGITRWQIVAIFDYKYQTSIQAQPIIDCINNGTAHVILDIPVIDDDVAPEETIPRNDIDSLMEKVLGEFKEEATKKSNSKKQIINTIICWES